MMHQLYGIRPKQNKDVSLEWSKTKQLFEVIFMQKWLNVEILESDLWFQTLAVLLLAL